MTTRTGLGDFNRRRSANNWFYLRRTRCFVFKERYRGVLREFYLLARRRRETRLERGGKDNLHEERPKIDWILGIVGRPCASSISENTSTSQRRTREGATERYALVTDDKVSGVDRRQVFGIESPGKERWGHYLLFAQDRSWFSFPL